MWAKPEEVTLTIKYDPNNEDMVRARMLASFEKLDRALAVVQAKEPEEVYMNTWFHHDPDWNETRYGCGTVACVAGWCATDSWFIDQGFALKKDDWGVQVPHMYEAGDTGDRWGPLAISIFFDLYDPRGHAIDWFELFGHRGGSSFDVLIDATNDAERFEQRLQFHKANMIFLFKEKFKAQLM